jgi:hypothetical protein
MEVKYKGIGSWKNLSSRGESLCTTYEFTTIGGGFPGENAVG